MEKRRCLFVSAWMPGDKGRSGTSKERVPGRLDEYEVRSVGASAGEVDVLEAGRSSATEDRAGRSDVDSERADG